MYRLDFKQSRILWCQWSSGKHSAVCQREMGSSTVELLKLSRVIHLYTRVCPGTSPSSMWMFFKEELDAAFPVRSSGHWAAHLPEFLALSRHSSSAVSQMLTRPVLILLANTTTPSTHAMARNTKKKVKMSSYHQRLADSEGNCTWGHRFQHFHCLCQGGIVQVFLVDEHQAIARQNLPPALGHSTCHQGADHNGCSCWVQGILGGKKIKKTTPKWRPSGDASLECAKNTQARSSSDATGLEPAETFKKTTLPKNSVLKGRYSITCLIH